MDFGRSLGDGTVTGVRTADVRVGLADVVVVGGAARGVDPQLEDGVGVREVGAAAVLHGHGKHPHRQQGEEEAAGSASGSDAGSSAPVRPRAPRLHRVDGNTSLAYPALAFVKLE